jgi:hypothetical protein
LGFIGSSTPLVAPGSTALLDHCAFGDADRWVDFDDRRWFEENRGSLPEDIARFIDADLELLYRRASAHLHSRVDQSRPELRLPPEMAWFQVRAPDPNHPWLRVSIQLEFTAHLTAPRAENDQYWVMLACDPSAAIRDWQIWDWGWEVG